MPYNALVPLSQPLFDLPSRERVQNGVKLLTLQAHSVTSIIPYKGSFVSQTPPSP